MKKRLRVGITERSLHHQPDPDPPRFERQHVDQRSRRGFANGAAESGRHLPHHVTATGSMTFSGMTTSNGVGGINNDNAAT
jgi:hypothetical protein